MKKEGAFIYGGSTRARVETPKTPEITLKNRVIVYFREGQRHVALLPTVFTEMSNAYYGFRLKQPQMPAY